ncbi:GDSL esterase/lipase At1g28580-like [Salvia hispanica]|uniref:GDSL esterase/lipase At1g28580-like n=1 Tax=Salvia hispanica TaxID=49212 RepID=UPI0020096AAA|nr:GDSL esterase/lipase At1g28580-like [Salvia hispanica]
MASSSSSSTNPMIICFFLLFLSSLTKHASSSPWSLSACYDHIIGFGDSLADTGNLGTLYPSDPPMFMYRPPYGETFFHHPTGRCSNGRLIIDFIAQYLGLHLVPPFYDGKNSSDVGSVNFAVAGASALPDSYFLSKGIAIRQANVSLWDQLGWFKNKFLPKFQCLEDQQSFLRSALVLVGEVGGNDYNHALLDGASKDLVFTFVPDVVGAISSTVRELINQGARTLFVPGNLPIGCSATYLSQFKSSNKSDYNPKTGCLNWLNEFVSNHNTQLRAQLDLIQKENPHTDIIYADYYNAAMRFYLNPKKYGFSKGALTACCPKCAPYKLDNPDAETCHVPPQYVSWDGLHLTESAYSIIAKGLIKESYTIPQIEQVCANHMFNRTYANPPRIVL